MMGRVALAMTAALLALAPAHACRCANVSIEERVANADQIFVGTAVETTTLANGQLLTSFKRARTLKGTAMPDISIRHLDVSGTRCETSFSDLAGPTLVIAKRIDGELTTSMCLNLGAEERDVRRALGLPILE